MIFVCKENMNEESREMVKSFLFLSVVISVKVWFCVHLINERDAFSDKKKPVKTSLNLSNKK